MLDQSALKANEEDCMERGRNIVINLLLLFFVVTFSALNNMIFPHLLSVFSAATSPIRSNVVETEDDECPVPTLSSPFDRPSQTNSRQATNMAC